MDYCDDFVLCKGQTLWSLSNSELRQAQRELLLRAKADHCMFLARCPLPLSGFDEMEEQYGQLETADFLPPLHAQLQDQIDFRDCWGFGDKFEPGAFRMADPIGPAQWVELTYWRYRALAENALPLPF